MSYTGWTISTGLHLPRGLVESAKRAAARHDLRLLIEDKFDGATVEVTVTQTSDPAQTGKIPTVVTGDDGSSTEAIAATVDRMRDAIEATL